jgi:hypothetical protein
MRTPTSAPPPKTRRRFTLSLLSLLAFTLTLVSCSSPLTTLDIVVTAAEAAVPILQAAGVPVPPAIPTYLADVSQCIATDGGAANPTTAQLAAISVCLTTLIAPTLTGLPAAIVTAIGDVIKDVAAYLASSPTPAHRAKEPMALNTANAAQLHAIAGRAGAVASKCHALWPSAMKPPVKK